MRKLREFINQERKVSSWYDSSDDELDMLMRNRRVRSRIKEEIGDIVNHTLMSIDIANLKPIEKIKLLQVLCQYIIPRLTTQHLDIEKRETPREVQITIVDTDGNVKEKVKETTEVVSMLDEKDLGLMEDMNEIIWGDVD